MARHSTIEDVARLAEVSIATVSRVFHTPDKVAKKTRDRVQEAIASSGYSPNVMARNLRARQSKMILVLVPDIANPFFSQLLLGIENIAHQHGYGVLIGNTDNKSEIEATYLRYISGHQADGLILLNGRLPKFDRGHDNLPIICISERPDDQDAPFVGIDNVSAATEAVTHLIDLGHRKIAFLTGPQDNVLTEQRLQGYKNALQKASISYDLNLILKGNFTLASGIEAATRLTSLPGKPTACFCSNDESAIGMIRGLHDQGVAIPSDIAIVGFDDIQFAAAISPALTTIRQPVTEFGEQAMEMLIGILNKNPKTQTERILPHQLVIRNSS